MLLFKLVTNLPHENAPVMHLDTVQDCADLSGTFPENVLLDFVYHHHGRNSESKQITYPLAPYLSGADCVGLESSGSDNPKKLEREVRRASAGVHSTGARLLHKFLNDIQGCTTASEEIDNIAQGIRAINGVVPREFFLADGYDAPKPPAVPAAVLYAMRPDEGLALFCQNTAIRNRIRENAALRKIHAKANEIVDDGNEHRIAVVFGSSHSLLSVAARALGANVRRHYVAPARSQDVSFYPPYYRSLRFQGNESQATTTQSVR